MDRIRTVLLVLAGVVVVGLLARTPAEPPLVRPSGTDQPSDTSIPLPSARPIPAVLSDPTLDVIRLDEPTLTTPVPPDLRPVTRIAQRFLASTGPGPLLLADQIDDGARVREVDLARTSVDWWTDRIDPVWTLVWLGSSGSTRAWVRRDGIIQVRNPGLAAADRTLMLPEGRRPVDARLLDERTLAVLTAAGPDEPATVTVLDVDAHLTVLETPVSTASGTPMIAHAWDTQARLLLVVDDVELQAVDLRTGLIEVLPLPVPTARQSTPPAATVLTVSAAGGLIAVSGVDMVRVSGAIRDTVPHPYGVALIRAYGRTTIERELQLLAYLDDRSSIAASVLSRQRVLLVDEEGRGRLVDDASSEVQLLAQDHRILEVLPGPGATYLTGCDLTGPRCGPGARPQALTAIDPSTGAVLGRRDLDATFRQLVAEHALLITGSPR